MISNKHIYYAPSNPLIQGACLPHSALLRRSLTVLTYIGYLLAHTVLKPDVPVVLYLRSVTPAPIGKKQEDENFRASFGYIGSSEATVVYPA